MSNSVEIRLATGCIRHQLKVLETLATSLSKHEGDAHWMMLEEAVGRNERLVDKISNLETIVKALEANGEELERQLRITKDDKNHLYQQVVEARYGKDTKEVRNDDSDSH